MILEFQIKGRLILPLILFYFNHYFMRIILSLSIVFVFFSCNNSSRFKKIDADYSGIDFNNEIIQNDSINIIDEENIYNGGGVGVGDFNNDGLEDLYFSGNLVSNKLYLNQGQLKFKDITDIAKVSGSGKFSRGVSIVDINQDGWDDIYVSVTISKDSIDRENLLYVNQGLNKDGIPIFAEKAAEYGLNDNSFTTQTAFFDYDNDGDLDAYLAVNVFGEGENPNVFHELKVKGEHRNTDRLYENNWDEKLKHPVFKNIGKRAGILQEGLAHSVTICDINLDGWKDIFVTNDYLSEDLFYINNKNGTFTNQSKKMLQHTSFNAMGADVVDLNNDGLAEIFELDMNPEDNYRKKTMLNGGNYQSYAYNKNYNIQYQYIRNILHLNRGRIGGDSLNLPHFSDISFYSGLAETDWSWTPLIGDFDNDFNRDIIVTNGFPKDVTDHDFMAFRNSAFAYNAKDKLLSKIPEVKIANYAFHNKGNLQFEDLSKEWGLDFESFSNGAVSSDLDNDGDLDVIINNINQEATLLENKTNESEISHNFLKINLTGNKGNRDAYGTIIHAFSKKGNITYETNPVRGYLSSTSNKVFFGLGDISLIDSIEIIWPNNLRQVVRNVKANQEINIIYATSKLVDLKQKVEETLLITSNIPGLEFQDSQLDYNDFAIQRTLIHKFSETNPPISIGDFNGDNLDDIIIGSSNGKSKSVYFQSKSGRFLRSNFGISTDTLSIGSDKCIVNFDIDNDGDLDLYLARGGYSKATSKEYADEIFINDGKGNFKKSNFIIPAMLTSNSTVKVADLNKDGLLDLFVSSNVIPENYPKKPSSYLLINKSTPTNVLFIDATTKLAPELNSIGLVTDAEFVDFNNDELEDIIIVGEWMAPTFFQKTKFGFRKVDVGMSQLVGWWQSIEIADFDLDGKKDFILGNFGLNSAFTNDSNRPIENIYGDFDHNGHFETIPVRNYKNKDGALSLFPTNSRDEIVEQMPSIKKDFLEYKEFALADIYKLIGKKNIIDAYHVKANFFSSIYVKNLGKNKFNWSLLPNSVQYSPLKSTIVRDFNFDGHLDLLYAGNEYAMEVFNGRLDGSFGGLLLGDSKGHFRELSSNQSGIFLPLETATMGVIHINNVDYIIALPKKGKQKIYKMNRIN